MKKILKILSFLFLLSTAYPQIIIDGDMLDWAGIAPLDQGLPNSSYGQVSDPTYIDFNLQHIYIVHDSDFVYCKIDLYPQANFNNFYNFSNPPVFEMYLDTEIGDTTGFDWGWWNNAYKYYINLAPTLHPDSTNKHAELYLYTGNRIPTYAPGEFIFLGTIPMAINSENNQIEFAIPRNLVNFGSEFRPWVYSVGDFQWSTGASQLPLEGQTYMLKYDFWYGGSVFQAKGNQIISNITIDGNLGDWVTAGIQPADVDEAAEELGDMPTGSEFDVKDFYITSDTDNVYLRIDINPSATFAGMYNNYPNPPVFKVFFEINWGDTTGLGYGGFWRLPADYMLDLSAALHPDSTNNLLPIYKYAGDWAGNNIQFVEIPDSGVFATFAKNAAGNSVEISVPRTAINSGTDIRPWIYVVGNGDYNHVEYVPNTIVEGWTAVPNLYYAINYNFIEGPTVHRLGDKSITAVEEEHNNISSVNGFGLVSNYPNPFNPTTTIEFTLPVQDVIKVEIYDVLGNKISTLINNQELSAGQKRVVWNGKNDNNVQVSSGVYIYKISSSKFSVSKKMMLLK
ncbi:MAG: T9SS type A sorting domain-containing protein [Ignavibacterium sp.]|uniref:T9SS type A sorting domain-containing protein n=1 Tax=Ignavibacterium sp. TaxID=2651167 RepID=UPI0040497420